MNAVDTSILLYAHDPRDAAKQAEASSLIQSLVDGVLLWQVACEYVAASRKLQSFGFDYSQACQDIRDLRRAWITLLPNWSVLDGAWRLLSSHSLSFWDAMLIAACIEGGVTRLYSEDFGDTGRIASLELVNPLRRT